MSFQLLLFSPTTFSRNDISSNRRLGQLLSIDLLEEKRRKIVRKIKLVEAEELSAKKTSKNKKMSAKVESVKNFESAEKVENVESVKNDDETSKGAEGNDKGQGPDETDIGKAEDDVKVLEAVEGVEAKAEEREAVEEDAAAKEEVVVVVVVQEVVPKAGQDQKASGAAQVADAAQAAISANVGQDNAAKN